MAGRSQAGARTVQYRSWRMPSERLTGVRPTTTASGRTDAGVHALGQVVNFLTASRHPTGDALCRGLLNALLPRDVRVLLEASEMSSPGSFHATLDAKSKRYRYVIDNARIASPFHLRYSWHVHHPLDSAAMGDVLAAGSAGPARLPQL